VVVLADTGWAPAEARTAPAVLVLNHRDRLSWVWLTGMVPAGGTTSLPGAVRLRSVSKVLSHVQV
jgi:uncharacterized membrane protein